MHYSLIFGKGKRTLYAILVALSDLSIIRCGIENVYKC